ncbi:MAG: PqqD family protein [Tannerella sp.]|jgi:hypothetical protein|nr:PqqD family protein [Tannerella sp.]
MKIKKGYILKEIAGEQVVIVQGKAGIDMTKIIAFNPVAAWLWSIFAETDFTENDVADKIAGQYGIDPATAASDARKWINQLLEAYMIE